MKGRFYLWQIEVNESLRNGFRIGKPFFVDVCCNVNTINTKEGDNLKITMQIKLQPTKEEIALLDFTMQEYKTDIQDDDCAAAIRIKGAMLCGRKKHL